MCRGLCDKTGAGRAPQHLTGRAAASCPAPPPSAGRWWRSPPHLGAPRGYLAPRAPTGQGARPRDAAAPCPASSATPGGSSPQPPPPQHGGEERREAPPQSPAAGRHHRGGCERGERVVARSSHSGGCPASLLSPLRAHPLKCEGMVRAAEGGRSGRRACGKRGVMPWLCRSTASAAAPSPSEGCPSAPGLCLVGWLSLPGSYPAK